MASAKSSRAKGALHRDEFLDAMHGLEAAIRELMQFERDKTTSMGNDLQRQIDEGRKERERLTAVTTTMRDSLDTMRLQIAERAAGEYRAWLVTALGAIFSVGIAVFTKMMR